jgi:hypothetical protein
MTHECNPSLNTNPQSTTQRATKPTPPQSTHTIPLAAITNSTTTPLNARHTHPNHGHDDPFFDGDVPAFRDVISDNPESVPEAENPATGILTIVHEFWDSPRQ